MAGNAITFRDALLPIVDILRGIPGQFGLRLFTVSIRSRTWTGVRPGLGTKTDVDTGLKVDLGIYAVKARQLTGRDVVSSGGLYTDQDWEVGPITPPYAGSAADNDAISVFEPPVGATPTELFFKMVGPGFPPAGAWFKKIGQRVDKSFRYTFTLRKTAEIP